MSKRDLLAGWVSGLGASLASLVKVVLLSRRPSPHFVRTTMERGERGEIGEGAMRGERGEIGEGAMRGERGERRKREGRERSLVVLGNGPSLRHTLEESPAWLKDSDCMAVNFAANTDMFRELRPAYYVLADPHFFHGEGKDQNVARLWENLLSCSWPMSLYVPVRERETAGRKMEGNANITIKTFNLTPAEGWRWLVHRLYDAGLAMPRPRNVMIPSIMIAMREGYREILLAGADHTWLQTLFVDDDNHVVSVQPHFYADNEKEKERVRSEYEGYHLHDILGSMTVAFRSYHQIADYARRRGVSILNATPGSYIDAFPRKK